MTNSLFAGGPGDCLLLALLVTTLAMMVVLRKLDERAERKAAQRQATGAMELSPNEATPSLQLPDQSPLIQTRGGHDPTA